MICTEKGKKGERIEVGDLIRWIIDKSKENQICLVTYTGIVSLIRPQSTWDNSVETGVQFANRLYKEDKIARLPTGTIIELEQE